MKEDAKAVMAKLQERRMKTIARMYQQGKTTKEIATKLKLSRSRIHQLCQAANHPVIRQPKYQGK